MCQYTKNYTIRTPELHNSTVHNIIPNRYLGNFTYGIDPAVLEGHGVNGASFCFFVNWDRNFATGRIDDHIWIKKELDIHERLPINLNDPVFMEKFLECEPLDEVRRKTELMKRYGLELSYTIIKKVDVDVPLSNNSKVVIDLKYNDSKFEEQIFTYGTLKGLLVQYTGRGFPMGKPLNWYETELEKILSLDRSGMIAPFPGDCDLMLYDNDFRCKAIIEYKKRTSHGAGISIANQTIDNYRRQDSLKYRRLELLREYLEDRDGSSIPLLIVFYSTANDNDIRNIKVEKISHDLQSQSSECFTLTSNDPRTNQSVILDHIMNQV